MIQQIGILFLIALNNVMNGQKIVATRPAKIESSVTVPIKSFQIEFVFGSENYNNQKLLLISTSLFRYGLSDTELGIKIHILKNENINNQVAIVSHVVIPTDFFELTNKIFATFSMDVAINQKMNYFSLGFS